MQEAGLAPIYAASLPGAANVSYSVKYFVDLAPLPQQVRLEIERTMERIAEAVSTVPEANPFWASMDDSVLQIDVSGCRVSYRVLPRARELRVIELEALPPKIP